MYQPHQPHHHINNNTASSSSSITTTDTQGFDHNCLIIPSISYEKGIHGLSLSIIPPTYIRYITHHHHHHQPPQPLTSSRSSHSGRLCRLWWCMRWQIAYYYLLSPIYTLNPIDSRKNVLTINLYVSPSSNDTHRYYYYYYYYYYYGCCFYIKGLSLYHVVYLSSPLAGWQHSPMVMLSL